MYLFYKFFKNKKLHIFYISFTVFIILNIFENYIHYSIGRHPDSAIIEFTAPTTLEWFKIIVVMLIFAALQGGFTYWME